MKRGLKILHTESHRQWGGQERRVFTECRWMSQKGHHIILLAPKQSEVYQRGSKEGWEVYDIPFTRIGMLKDFFLVRALLRKVRPDVLNTHGNTDSKVALAAAGGLKIPCVIRSRHSTPAVRNSWYNRLLYRKFSDYIFTTANCITDQLVRDLDVSRDRIFTLPSGMIARSDLPAHEDARQSLSAELGLGAETRFIGFVGRLSNEKGLTFLIEAFFKLRDIILNYHLVLIGQGGFLPRLEAQVRERNLRDRVHFLGYRENTWHYFRAFDCHVLASSKYEGTPQVILQAMFAECPVVGTNAGGIPDVIVHEETGLLVPPDNADLLAEAILKTLRDETSAKRRTRNALHYVHANHTLDKMGEKILEIYRKRLF
ncbi:MAG: hypothetical protein BWK80_24180 [Desulfobacteraceae bacterium IS3]|nr:MAG: hypothetical protein BWK80_24180 [Desulfobacteraceae bacterium IS3]